MAAMVRVAGNNGERPVDLLRGYDRGEFMGQSDSAKGKCKVSTFSGDRGPSIRWTDGNHGQLCAGCLPTAKFRRKFVGSQQFTAAVCDKENGPRPGGSGLQMP